MLRDKLSPGTKPGFLKSEKMLGFKLLYIHKSVSENVYVNNVIIYGWCYSMILTYNVFGWCYCQLGDIIPNHHFLFLQADVIAFKFLFHWQMLLLFSDTLLWIYKSLNPNICSDLRKPGLVPGESLSLSTKINSVLEKYLSYKSIYDHYFFEDAWAVYVFTFSGKNLFIWDTTHYGLWWQNVFHITDVSLLSLPVSQRLPVVLYLSILWFWN